MPNDNELIEILLQNKESKIFEYKGPCDWNKITKKDRCEIVKDILALGNTLGGYLIIGVEENTHGFSYTGLSEKQLASFDSTKINQFVNNYADPPINTTVNKVEHDDKYFVIIRVPKFPDTPHICQKDYPNIFYEGSIYVRTDNNESAPIKKSSDFRLIIENSIRNRTDQLLSSFRSILKHGPEIGPIEKDEEKFNKSLIEIVERCNELNPFINEDYGYCETVFFPSFFSEQYFEINQLKKMANNGSIYYAGLPFIFYDPHDSDKTYVVNNGLETCVSGQDIFTGGDAFHFWRLTRSGLLYKKEILDEDSYLRSKGDRSLVLDFDRLCRRAARAINCLVRIYTDFLPDEKIVVLKFRLLGLQGRTIDSILGTRMFIRGHYVSKIPEMEYIAKKPLAEWRAGVVDYSLELCNHVFSIFNYSEPNMEACKDVINEMFNR